LKFVVVAGSVAGAWNSEWRLRLRSHTHRRADLNPTVCQRKNWPSSACPRTEVSRF